MTSLGRRDGLQATVRQLETCELGPKGMELRALFDDAWGGEDEAFDETDWQHALGGDPFPDGG